MIFQVTPETQAILCLFIMAVAFLIAQIITTPDPAPQRRKRARDRGALRLISSN